MTTPTTDTGRNLEAGLLIIVRTRLTDATLDTHPSQQAMIRRQCEVNARQRIYEEVRRLAALSGRELAEHIVIDWTHD